MSITSRAVVARRPRSFVRIAGPDAEDFLQRMVSNDVAALAPGDVCDALLLTAKARVIAPLRVLRRAPEEFLLSTEPELGETVRAQLLRTRFAAKVEVEPEESEEEYERWRIEHGIPRWGREIDDRVLPAEAGLTETHVSFTKGCYPGQEPIARQHYRGKLNRRLRVLRVEGQPEPETEILHEAKTVGRITSSIDGLALGYVRVEVPDEAELSVGGRPARLH
jgi:folate-binding protein YgfZ